MAELKEAQKGEKGTQYSEKEVFHWLNVSVHECNEFLLSEEEGLRDL